MLLHSSGFRTAAVLLAATALFSSCAASGTDGHGQPERVLRVCADPNNLPFSNESLEGFENRLAELVADELDARVEYFWWPQRRGFVRHTLNQRACDVIMGVPSSFELAATTRPYYRSSYVFVVTDGAPLPESFDDPMLQRARIGVHVIGDDGANSPPAHALAARGIIDNVRGYSIYGDYRLPSPPADLIRAVAEGEIDVAIAWGPLAGYEIKQHRAALQAAPVQPEIDPPFLPFVFDIAMGVRRDDEALLHELDEILVRRRDGIDAILQEFGVPRVDRRASHREASH